MIFLYSCYPSSEVANLCRTYANCDTALRKVKRTFLLFSMPIEIVISSIYVRLSSLLLPVEGETPADHSTQWSIVLIKPELMFPPQTEYKFDNISSDSVGGAANAEPTNQTADLLFRIPLWMDISMHLLPAVALIIGMSLLSLYSPSLAHTHTYPCLLDLVSGANPGRLLLDRDQVPPARIHVRRDSPRRLVWPGVLALDRTCRHYQWPLPVPVLDGHVGRAAHSVLRGRRDRCSGHFQGSQRPAPVAQQEYQ